MRTLALSLTFAGLLVFVATETSRTAAPNDNKTLGLNWFELPPVHAATSGLVAAYAFNEGSGTTVTDASGNGNNGAISGANWTTAGKYGNALSFNGTNSWVTISDSSTLDLKTAVSLEAWIHPDTRTGWQAVVIKEQPAGLSYALYGKTNTTKPGLAIHTTSDINMYGPSATAANAWTHLAGTYDGTTMRLYVNGSLVKSQSVSGQMPVTASPLRIGGDSVWGEYFSGVIDEVRVYNRALSAAEISNDMNTPLAAVPQSGLTVSPSNITLMTYGSTQQLTVTASFSDGSSQDVTTDPATTYLSNNTSIATVSGTGLINAMANGSTTVTATRGGFSASANVTVNIPPPVQSGVTVTPASFTITSIGGTQQLTTLATYSDGSSSNVTANGGTTYVSSNPSVASVSSTGLVAAVSAGTASITASYGGYSASALGTVNTTPPPTGLVAAYNFNEGSGTSVADASGNGNVGVISGATWTTGRFGGGLTFNGLNSWITINDAATLTLTSGATLEAWVRPTAPTGWQAAILKEQPSDLSYGLYVNTDQDQSSGTVSINGNDVAVNDPSEDAQVSMYTWTHLATTFDGSKLKLYVNGFLVNSVPSSGKIKAGSGPLRIGGDSVWGEYFNGDIDEVRVYNRALSATEIASDMNSPINPPPLVSVSLSPAAFSIPVAGGLQQLTFTGSYSGAPSQNILLNTGVTYSSSNPSVATVTASGLATAVGSGTTTITASYGGLSQTASATVTLTSDPAAVGQWSAPVDFGVVAVNMVLLRTNKVLVYGGQLTSGKNARVFDPASGTSVGVATGTDLFCSGHTALADGRILVVGGHDSVHDIVGVADANIFDPVTQAWTSAPKMRYARWYPTATTLPDGRVLVTSGAQSCYGFRCLADVPEVYNPTTNSWSSLTAGRYAFWYYPFQFLLPDGRILVTGTSEQPSPTRTFNVSAQTWTTINSGIAAGGSAIMYAPSKIMHSGTGSDAGAPNVPAANTTFTIDMNQANPVWQQTAPMAAPRAYHNLTMLPDGSVLATGGENTLDGSSGANAVYQAELWSPATQTWTTLALDQTPRLYHSTAVLLPDARVLVGGGGSLYPATDYTSGEYFSPPYLFKGARPVISSAPSQITAGTSFNVSSPDAASIASIALIRPAAVTHQFNEDQHFLHLSFTVSNGSLTIQAPVDSNSAPPGYYMLFLINNAGVPSVASFVKVQ